MTSCQKGATQSSLKSETTKSLSRIVKERPLRSQRLMAEAKAGRSGGTAEGEPAPMDLVESAEDLDELSSEAWTLHPLMPCKQGWNGSTNGTSEKDEQKRNTD
eukprot:6139622-Amphidinium_carterae.1